MIRVVNVLIKNVDVRAYKAARLLAIRNDKNVGEIVSEAIVLLTRQGEKRGLAAAKPLHLGRGTEKLSQEIDEILYGD